MIPETKICGRCNIIKKACEFPLRKKNKGKHVWLRLQCYDCMREIGKVRYIKNREKVIERNKEYSLRNLEKVRTKQEKWRKNNYERIKKEKAEKYLENAEVVKAKRKEYYYKNKEKVIKLNNEYVESNKAKVRKRQRAHHAIKKETDIVYSLIKVLRTRVSAAIKRGGKKCNRTMDLVGCTIPELMCHLETKFVDGMDWGNYGFYGWHVDHIIPCASFDMSIISEQKKCFHYTNLQPLWWQDNLKKGSTISEKWDNIKTTN
jgi:hypothetical protein